MELGDKGLRCLTFVCCEEEEESGDALRGVRRSGEDVDAVGEDDGELSATGRRWNWDMVGAVCEGGQ